MSGDFPGRKTVTRCWWIRMERVTTPIKTPYFLVDETLLRKNLEILKDVSQRSGCKILLAQKAFSMFSTYPLIRQYLAGTTASGLFEARLGKEEFGGETPCIFPRLWGRGVFRSALLHR